MDENDKTKCKDLISLKEFLEKENERILVGLKLMNESNSYKTCERLCKNIIDNHNNIIQDIEEELRALKINLRFRMREAEESGFTKHPQAVMKDLGITYKEAIPQSLGDQWWFIDCENLPAKLPEFLGFMDWDGRV